MVKINKTYILYKKKNSFFNFPFNHCLSHSLLKNFLDALRSQSVCQWMLCPTYVCTMHVCMYVLCICFRCCIWSRRLFHFQLRISLYLRAHRPNNNSVSIKKKISIAYSHFSSSGLAKRPSAGFLILSSLRAPFWRCLLYKFYLSLCVRYILNSIVLLFLEYCSITTGY